MATIEVTKDNIEQIVDNEEQLFELTANGLHDAGSLRFGHISPLQ